MKFDDNEIISHFKIALKHRTILSLKNTNFFHDEKLGLEFGQRLSNIKYNLIK